MHFPGRPWVSGIQILHFITGQILPSWGSRPLRLHPWNLPLDPRLCCGHQTLPITPLPDTSFLSLHSREQPFLHVGRDLGDHATKEAKCLGGTLRAHRASRCLLCLAQDPQIQSASYRLLPKTSCVSNRTLDHTKRKLVDPPWELISLVARISVLPDLGWSLSTWMHEFYIAILCTRAACHITFLFHWNSHVWTLAQPSRAGLANKTSCDDKKARHSC